MHGADWEDKPDQGQLGRAGLHQRQARPAKQPVGIVRTGGLIALGLSATYFRISRAAAEIQVSEEDVPGGDMRRLTISGLAGGQ
jgi:hypothetical protein